MEELLYGKAYPRSARNDVLHQSLNKLSKGREFSNH